MVLSFSPFPVGNSAHEHGRRSLDLAVKEGGMGLKVCKRIEQQFQLRSEVDRIEGITTDLSHFITPNAYA